MDLFTEVATLDGQLNVSGTVPMFIILIQANLLIGSRHYNRFTDCKISQLMKFKIINIFLSNFFK